jgi:hypothetical protein
MQVSFAVAGTIAGVSIRLAAAGSTGSRAGQMTIFDSTMLKQVTRSNQRTPHPGRGCGERWPFIGAALLIVSGLMAPAQAAESGAAIGLRNLTSAPITQVYISPAGQNTFSSDQIALIPGGAVDHDKTLKLTGIAPGRYLLRVTDNAGRVCWVRNITLEANQVVSVQDKDLTDCDP